MKSNNNLSGMKLMDVITNKDSANRLLKSTQKSENVRLSAEQALALLIEANLTKSAYKLIRATALDNNHDLYPSYAEVHN